MEVMTMKGCHIKPLDINTKMYFSGTFPDDKTETVAYFLVEMAQVNGNEWNDFTQEEINDFSRSRKFPLDILIEFQEKGKAKPLIKKNDDGTYSFTKEFVLMCRQASELGSAVPKKGKYNGS